MEFWPWFQIVGAVIVGNGLTALYGFWLWQAVKREKLGLNPLGTSLGVSLCGLVPPVLAIIAMFSLSG